MPVDDGVGGQLRDDQFSTLRELLGAPQECSDDTASSRASRAPRRVDDRSWVKQHAAGFSWGTIWFMTPEWRPTTAGDERRTPYAESAYGHGRWTVRGVTRHAES
ncbi:hypothetical protein SF23_01940 [Streptomyces sp. MBRL 10]|nr:hypothetical protein SF23_01940 [Streptomyces sp. MBRL 10]